MASLTVKGLNKKFGKVVALSGVDLHVDEGEFCVLLGPSGCGKSTLLNIIAGLIPQDEGTVMMDGSPIENLPPRDRDVAMVFQNYALYPHLTVQGNLKFALEARRHPKKVILKKVRETAKFLNIEDLLDRKPGELSGGQQQRVAMGRALVRRPRIFLLDEPLSNLDARLRALVRVELKRLHQEIRATIIYVTHDQVEAMTLGDRVVVMHDGKVCQIGSPGTVYSTPADSFVASFIGSPEINLYRGKIIYENEQPFFKGNGFSLNLRGHQLNPQLGEVEAGIRPEDIALAQGPGVGLEARVELVTDVGSEQYIYARLGEETLTLRAPKGSAPAAGTMIPLDVKPEQIHVFHNGLRI
jgi:multiple sugar transport system ATP-binding protein